MIVSHRDKFWYPYMDNRSVSFVQILRGVSVRVVSMLGNATAIAAESAATRSLSKTQKIVAVTGGAGFLGSHLCDRLTKQGDFVVCIDNFHTGRRKNVEHLFDTNRFLVVDHDVRISFAAELPRFDEIYNLACPASPVHYQEDRVKTALTCALGSLHVFERAARDNARVFHASTSEVYGDPEVHPQPEFLILETSIRLDRDRVTMKPSGSRKLCLLTTLANLD